MNIKRLFIMISITAAGIYFSACSDNKANTSLKDTAVSVEVAPVVYSDGSAALSYSGTIEESETIPLTFSGVGTISKVYVSEGEVVRKGKLLAELDDESYRNSYDIAQALEKQAQDAYNRLLPMHKNGNLPEIKFIEAETGLQQAKASAAIAKKSLADCKLYSPVDGVVGKRSVEPGMTAMPNLASITIVKIQKVFAIVSVPENEISAVKKGDKANIRIAALNNSEFTGTVEETGVIANPVSHSYKIKIAINNKDNQVKPGMICNVNLLRESKSARLMVPGEAVRVDENGNTFVYAVSSSRDNVERRKVKTGILFNNGIEIISGLNEGEKVVVTGQQKLADKSLIKIINNQH
jgi:membrane fusion protein (multidrug efflux system)